MMVHCLKPIMMAGDCICPSIKALIRHPTPNMLRQLGIFPLSAFSFLSRLLWMCLIRCCFIIQCVCLMWLHQKKITIFNFYTVVLSIPRLDMNDVERKTERRMTHRERESEKMHARGREGENRRGRQSLISRRTNGDKEE